MARRRDADPPDPEASRPDRPKDPPSTPPARPTDGRVSEWDESPRTGSFRFPRT